MHANQATAFGLNSKLYREKTAPAINISTQIIRLFLKSMVQSYSFSPSYLSSMIYIPEIRFSDIDSYGIVHNAKFLIFFEQSRIALFSKISGEWDWKKSGVLVANQEVNYKVPVTMRDKLEILVWIESLGNKSMTYAYEGTKL